MSYNCSITSINPDGQASKKASSWLLGQIRSHQESIYMVQPFSSVEAFFKEYQIVPPKGYWRLTEFLLGHINGFPSSYGRLVATNGIMCYLVRYNQFPFCGHIDSFIHEEKFDLSAKRSLVVGESTKAKNVKNSKKATKPKFDPFEKF